MRLVVVAVCALLVTSCGSDGSDDGPGATPDPSPGREPSSGTTVASDGTLPPDALERDEPVRLRVVVDDTEVRPGERIEGTLVATNEGASQVDITHPGCHVSYGLYLSGRLVTEAPVCAAVVTPDSIAPGEERTWTFQFEASAADGGRLAPGRYDLFAGIATYGAGRGGGDVGGAWYAPPVPVTVAG